MIVAALILAGGESRRMGVAKATLELDGRSFVARAIELLRAVGCAPVLVVDGAHVLADAAIVGAQRVHNTDWQLGPLSSLQVGLKRALALEDQLEARLDAVVVHPVERPRVRVDTLEALLAGLAREPDAIWQPTHAGQSGHPIVWPRVCFDELLALDPARETARTLVRGRAASRRRKLEVDDAGVLDNIDTPADVAALSGHA